MQLDSWEDVIAKGHARDAASCFRTCMSWKNPPPNKVKPAKQMFATYLTVPHLPFWFITRHHVPRDILCKNYNELNHTAKRLIRKSLSFSTHILCISTHKWRHICRRWTGTTITMQWSHLLWYSTWMGKLGWNIHNIQLNLNTKSMHTKQCTHKKPYKYVQFRKIIVQTLELSTTFDTVHKPSVLLCRQLNSEQKTTRWARILSNEHKPFWDSREHYFYHYGCR